jgi:hypothetical protein
MKNYILAIALLVVGLVEVNAQVEYKVITSLLFLTDWDDLV